MNEDLKRHLPVIVIATLACIAGTVLALMSLKNAAGGMQLDAFSLAVFVIPCIAMLVGSFVIMVTSEVISRKLFVVVTGICLATGVVAMVVTSSWFQDATLVEALLANSPDGTAVTVPIQSPIIVMRDIAAYVVCPAVGSIAGAWVGSRLHPMRRVK